MEGGFLVCPTYETVDWGTLAASDLYCCDVIGEQLPFQTVTPFWLDFVTDGRQRWWVRSQEKGQIQTGKKWLRPFTRAGRQTQRWMERTVCNRDAKNLPFILNISSQWDIIFFLAWPYYFSLNSIFTGSGTGVGSAVIEESTGITREVVGKDSHHQDMIWVPSRNAWEEIGKIISTDYVKLIWTSMLLKVKKCPL